MSTNPGIVAELAEPPKFCVNCAHYRPAADVQFSRCGRAPTKQGVLLHMVTGIAPTIEDFYHCTTERDDLCGERACGSGAKFFEAKEKSA